MERLNIPHPLSVNVSRENSPSSPTLSSISSITPKFAHLVQGLELPNINKTNESRFIHYINNIILQQQDENNKTLQENKQQQPSEEDEEEETYLNHNHHIQCSTCDINYTFISNIISTSKYTIYNFFPINLWEQFHKKANIYFLMDAVISCTSISPKTPIVTIFPLSIVLGATALKEAIEDYQRHKMDLDLNNKSIEIYNQNKKKFELIQWKDIKVGDIVRVKNDQSLPCDMLLLKSSEKLGSCMIETANLDGETNLKSKKGIPETYSINCKSDGSDYPVHLPSCIIESSLPSKRLDNSSGSWSGNLTMVDDNNIIPLAMDSLLLRGCSLRATRWIIGISIFTGNETKVMLNQKMAPFKRSSVDHMVDYLLYFIFFIQFSLCTFGAIALRFWLEDSAFLHWYLPYIYEGELHKTTDSALNWFTFIVLLDIFVPISLYVSLELTKVCHGYWINHDIEIYDPISNNPANARTTNLNEELGQLTHIFSDKTGTLTQNMMNFYSCSINGILYDGNRKNGGNEEEEDISSSSNNNNTYLPLIHEIPPRISTIPFHDNKLIKHLLSSHNPNTTTDPNTISISNHNPTPALSKFDSNPNPINEFFTCLTLCNTVYPIFPKCEIEHEIHTYSSCGNIEYNSASPDEKALVENALNHQYFMYYRHPVSIQIGKHIIQNAEEICVNILGIIHSFHIIEIFPFDSTRARMSVLILDPRDGLLKLYTKGADSVILPLLSNESKETTWPITNIHLNNFAITGLRTLVCGYRIVSIDEFEEWYPNHMKAKTIIANRDFEISLTTDMIEGNHRLELLGATAIEDKLQDDVPVTIYKMLKAGIKVWMITGDKLETAINIGKACNLITSTMIKNGLKKIELPPVLSVENARMEIYYLLLDCMEKLNEWEQTHHKSSSEEEEDKETLDLALVIGGRELTFVFPDSSEEEYVVKSLPVNIRLKRRVTLALMSGHAADVERQKRIQKLFLNICQKCRAVICCRTSPAQKSEIVSLVKRGVPTAITCAVGDGANDVSMIRAAHVGIGISGFEGLQATMASDYSIAQFRFLQRLLFVHGNWSYRRIAYMILYSFYKSIALVSANFYFAFASAFSGTMYFDPYLASAYNVLWTAWPVLLTAWFNRYNTPKTLLAYPELYKNGPSNNSLSFKLLFTYIISGFIQSFLIYYIAAYVFGSAIDGNLSYTGQVRDQWMSSSAFFTWILLVVQFQCILNTTTWPWFSILMMIAEIICWFVVLYIYSIISYDHWHIAHRLFADPAYWLWSLIIIIICLIPEFCYKFIKRTWYPTLSDILFEKEQGYNNNNNNNIHEIDINKKKNMEIELPQKD